MPTIASATVAVSSILSPRPANNHARIAARARAVLAPGGGAGVIPSKRDRRTPLPTSKTRSSTLPHARSHTHTHGRTAYRHPRVLFSYSSSQVKSGMCVFVLTPSQYLGLSFRDCCCLQFHTYLSGAVTSGRPLLHRLPLPPDHLPLLHRHVGPRLACPVCEARFLGYREPPGRCTPNIGRPLLYKDSARAQVRRGGSN